VAKVEIYTSMWCGYCGRAKSLLIKKGAEFIEYDVDSEPAKRREMEARSNGGYTVPQIFINDEHIGGSDDLAALERAGQLDAKLAA
jgi:glutaredoxin 3